MSWEREVTQELAALLHITTLDRFEIMNNSGCIWNLPRQTVIDALGTNDKYTMYDLYVDFSDYSVVMKVLIPDY